MRRFLGLKLSGPLPDETTILNFRHLLENHKLGQGLLDEINAHLEFQGLRLREGTIVDATIIEAPSSTKNRAGERDPEMHQTKKGNQWHFGMKDHIGVDAGTGIVHSMSAVSLRAPSPERASTVIEYELCSSKSGPWPAMNPSMSLPSCRWRRRRGRRPTPSMCRWCHRIRRVR